MSYRVVNPRMTIAGKFPPHSPYRKQRKLARKGTPFRRLLTTPVSGKVTPGMFGGRVVRVRVLHVTKGWRSVLA